MASVSVEKANGARTGALLFACVAEHGSAAHPYFASEALLSGPDSARNLADAIHFLCALHGRLPGVVEFAALRSIEPAARAWLAEAGEAMAVERHYLTRLAVAAGPAPGTPGGATSETAVIGQRNALSTLSQSDRRGCALGAAIAFAADWTPIRGLLDKTARRLGLDAPAQELGTPEALLVIADDAGEPPAVSRAMLFGAQQFALQHRGLWDLLEARQQARRDG
ncbi:hypothetical protein RCO27_04655 [Sphingosinicella sp. LHD-64]|uniref:DUF6975 family protein n=1 Tax=Sphingosinicella sp. LHD-64 TaxID=3072139 RepID=UPI00280F93A7|nr:hypothetical protein [Sphingosinicella sp. LHD-64]MDQ8755512.1 hypothetical protein [Sphingosinicella sp. LHD-64]